MYKTIDVDVEIEFQDIVDFIENSSKSTQKDILTYIGYDLILDEVQEGYKIPRIRNYRDAQFQKACFALMHNRHALPKEIEETIIRLAKENTI